MNSKTTLLLMIIGLGLYFTSCRKTQLTASVATSKEEAKKLLSGDKLLILCETTQDRILIVNTTTGADVWSWTAAADAHIATADKPYFKNPTDAKRVLDGNYILATFNTAPSGAPESERGGVALISYPAGNTVFYSRCGYQPHSAEILPDGNIVVLASSSNAGIRVFKMDREHLPSTTYKSDFIPAPAVHGIVWDKKRQKLLIAGTDKIYVYDYDFNLSHPAITKVDSIVFGWANRNAHDLFPVYGQDTLWLASHQLFKIDMNSKVLQTGFDTTGNIKSVSSGPPGYPVALQIAPGGTIYTSNKIVEAGTHNIIFQRTGLTIYKARWFINDGPYGAGVPYSYRTTKPKKLDFNNDGKTDFSMFNPSGSTTDWKVFANPAYTVFYGSGTQIPVPGDYDGDGHIEQAVFNPANHVWHFANADSVTYGANTDIPVPADYNGDGKDDIAIWRPSTSQWYIRNQNTGVTYGVPGDIPVPGDYDGDGLTDFAIYRAATGGANDKFYIRLQTTLDFGITESCIPVPGDYNGDGKDDIALYSRVTGKWLIKSTTNYATTINANTIVSFSSSDIPCSGDFLELGKSLPAVFRPSTGTLYIDNNGTIITQTLSGISGYKLLNLPYGIREVFFP